MTKIFRGRTQIEAEAKADAWVATQRGLKNIRRHSYLFRAAFIKIPSEGEWTVSLHYDQASAHGL
jgi:hypothetical protein